jgi:hypothetical protein
LWQKKGTGRCCGKKKQSFLSMRCGIFWIQFWLEVVLKDGNKRLINKSNAFIQWLTRKDNQCSKLEANPEEVRRKTVPKRRWTAFEILHNSKDLKFCDKWKNRFESHEWKTWTKRSAEDGDNWLFNVVLYSLKQVFESLFDIL